MTFIIPPSPFLLDERVFMSLGILKVAAVARHLGYQPKVLDLSGVSNYLDVIDEILKVATPNSTFAITSTTPQFPSVFEICAKLRANGHRVILGGPHPTMVMSAHKRGLKRAQMHADRVLACADTVVTGDGELAFKQAIEMTKNGGGWLDADDPKTGLFMTHEQFNDSPWPARDLVDVGSYHYEISGKRSLSVIGQLGCPMACAFCSGRNSPTFRRIRLRGASNVVAEIEHLVKEYDTEGIMFYDDELNINNAFTELMTALIDMQMRLGKGLAFRGFVKSELFTEAHAKLMAEAGFKTLLSGFESGSPRILENINKKATVDDNTRCLDVARKHGIHMKALMSIGHAGETEETVDATRQWLIKVQPEDFDVTIITVLPGSPYFDASVQVPHPLGESHWVYTAKNGDRLYSVDIDYSKTMDYYKGVPGEYVSFVYTDDLTPKQLVTLRDDLENEVRPKLGLKPLQLVSAKNYDHSMGAIPAHIMKL
jgi:anaerobic magnesium-protoporphyrin IX monomethyl ester cyclase